MYTVNVPPPCLEGVPRLEDVLLLIGGVGVALNLLANVGREELEGANSVGDGKEVREGFTGEIEVLALVRRESEPFNTVRVANAETLGEGEDRDDPDTFIDSMAVKEDARERLPEKDTAVVSEEHGLENNDFVGKNDKDGEGEETEDLLALGEGE